MSRNRILGTPQNSNTLPAASGSSYQETYQDDLLSVPSTAAPGTPYCTLNLNGSISGQPADGDTLDIADPFGVLGAGTTLNIVAKVGSQGFPILEGNTAVNSVTLSQPGSRRQYMFSGALSAWVATSVSNGTGSGALTTVSNIAAMSALSTAGMPLGAWVKPETIDQPYELVPATVVPAPDGINVVASSNPALVWSRLLMPSALWTAQKTWIVDPAIGNNENPGNAWTAAGALASVAEVARRLVNVDFTGYVVQVMTDTAATDRFDFNPHFTSSGVGVPGANNATQGTLTLLGQNGPTTAETVAAGSVGVTTFGTTPSGASTVPVAASGGQQATLNAQGVAAGFWSGHLNSLVVLTGGAMAGFRATILKDMNGAGFAGTARLDNWWTPLGAALAGTVGVTNGQTAITFTNPQTLPAGQIVEFANQLGVQYVLAQPLVAGTAGVLTTAFTGATNAADTVQPYSAPIGNGTLATVGQVPANGDPFIVVDGYTKFNGTFRMQAAAYTMVAVPMCLTFPATSQLLFVNGDARPTQCQEFCSQTYTAGGTGFNARVLHFKCAVSPTAPAANAGGVVNFDGRTRFIASAVVNSTLCAINTGRIECVGLVCQGGAAGSGIKVGRGFVGFTGDTSQDSGQLGLFSAGDTLGLGIFDATAAGTNGNGAGLGVYRDAEASIDAPLYGLGNTIGTDVNEGGTLIRRSTITPVLTGTTELVLAGSGTALAGLEADAPGPLPAASALTTWAQQLAGPFNGNTVNYTNGAKIITAANPD